MAQQGGGGNTGFAAAARERSKQHREAQQLAGVGVTHWPDWKCKNNCGRTWPEDTDVRKCPHDGAPLVRYRNYEEKT